MNPFARDSIKASLEGKKVLLCVTGSIAAFKACDIVRGLRECGAIVRVVLTDSALKFVTKVTLETLSGQPVLTSLWEEGVVGEQGATRSGTHHIDTARWADVALVAPATANSIAKLALGLADDLMSTELLAFTGPLLVAPAMNPAMYAHPAVQANVHLLEERGTRILGPCVGVTSCGEEGLGRMIEPDEIVEAVAQSFYAPSNGKRILLTLGPTRSNVDPVRYLTNRSSGLMGASIAWAAVQRGYQVTAICGPSECALPRGIEVVRVTTADEMADAALSRWTAHDAFVSAAAVLDWDVKEPRAQKLKKTAGAPSIELKPNLDILAAISKLKRRDQFVLGFAAETERPVEHALEKLEYKGCDAIFANDVSRADQGFESTMNSGWWITKARTVDIARGTKQEVAREIVSRIPCGKAQESFARSAAESPSASAPNEEGLDGQLH